MPGSVFVSRLARVVAAQPGCGGPRRTGADHWVGHAAVAAARRPFVAATRLRDHATPRARHQAHVGAVGPNARLQSPLAQDHGPMHRPRAGRLGRGPRNHLQPSRRRADGRFRRRPATVSATASRHRGRGRGIPDAGHHVARSPRRRRHYQESRSRSDTRYTVTAGRQIGAPRRVSAAHGESSSRYFFFPLNTTPRVPESTPLPSVDASLLFTER